MGRIDSKTQEDLYVLLKSNEDVEFITELNFRDTIMVNGKLQHKNTCMNELDAYFWYSEVDRSIWSYDLDALKTLSKTTKVYPNPDAFEKGLDKFLSHTELYRCGIDVADTILFSRSNLRIIQSVIQEFGPCILKPRRWWFGKGVMFIPNYPTIRDIVEYIGTESGNAADDVFMLEKYYPNDIERWVSVTVINGKIMYGYRKRKCKHVPLWWDAIKIYDENEIWGEVDYCEVTPAQEKASIAAYKALGMDIIWFDFIVTSDRSIIVDENTFPGFYREIFDQAGIDPAKEIYDMILDRIQHLSK